MRQDEWDELRHRFDYRCAYCGIRESDAGAELTVDHFHPQSRGGAHSLDNWVYRCHACNEFKGDYWSPGTARQILHPHRHV
jgi:5-methylcytosine-specific restriction endonuclease McrA